VRLKILKILRAASFNSEFTASCKKVYLRDVSTLTQVIINVISIE